MIQFNSIFKIMTIAVLSIFLLSVEATAEESKQVVANKSVIAKVVTTEKSKQVVIKKSVKAKEMLSSLLKQGTLVKSTAGILAVPLTVEFRCFPSNGHCICDPQDTIGNDGDADCNEMMDQVCTGPLECDTIMGGGVGREFCYCSTN